MSTYHKKYQYRLGPCSQHLHKFIIRIKTRQLSAFNHSHTPKQALCVYYVYIYIYPGSQPPFKKWWFLLEDDKPYYKKWWFGNQPIKMVVGLPGYILYIYIYVNIMYVIIVYHNALVTSIFYYVPLHTNI